MCKENDIKDAECIKCDKLRIYEEMGKVIDEHNRRSYAIECDMIDSLYKAKRDLRDEIDNLIVKTGRTYRRRVGILIVIFALIWFMSSHHYLIKWDWV